MAIAIIVMGLLIASAVCAPQASLNDAKPTNPLNMSYEELEYILKTKRGESGNPPKTLAPCARAILGCCNKEVMNTHCSELLNCGAFFFDSNPCEEQYVISALQAAKTFYKQVTSPI